jgi:acetyl esterase/lipase
VSRSWPVRLVGTAGLLVLAFTVWTPAAASILPVLTVSAHLGFRVVPGPLPPDPEAPTPILLAQYDLVYYAVNGIPLTMDFAKPAACQWQSVPVVVCIHGGSWRSGDKEGGLDRPESRMLFQLGFAVACINYRLVPEAIFPAQIEDCKRAIRFLRVNAASLGIDPDHIGVIGNSAGGHLATLAAAANDDDGLEGTGYPGVSSRVSCVVDYYGPADFTLFDGYTDPDSIQAILDLLGCTIGDCSEQFLIASPVEYINAGDPPFLILHGNRDSTVPYNQSRSLAGHCLLAGVPCALVKVLNAGHGFQPDPPDAVTAPSLQEIWRMAVAHFARYLEPACFGDVNLDGKLDMVDVLEIIHLEGSLGVGPWGESAPADWNPLADLNADGRIDGVDVALFLQYRLATE